MAKREAMSCTTLAVHEIATPLATLCVTLGELRCSGSPPPDWKEQIDLLWEQAQRCKRALAEMRKAAAAQQP